MPFDPKQKNASPKERAIWSDLLSLGMVFPIAITLGFFIGKWVGNLIGYTKTGIIVGLIWGMSAGFWELYKMATRLNRMDKKNTHHN